MSRCRARFLSCFLLLTAALAQDASTGAIRGTVSDQAGGRIPGATVALVNNATGLRYSNSTDTEGRFVLQLLPPGDYSGRALSPGNVTPDHAPIACGDWRHSGSGVQAGGCRIHGNRYRLEGAGTG